MKGCLSTIKISSVAGVWSIGFFSIVMLQCLNSCKHEDIVITGPSTPSHTSQPWPTSMKIVNAADMHAIPGADVYLYTDPSGTASWPTDIVHIISDDYGMVNWTEEDGVVQICVEAEGFYGECGSSGSFLDYPSIIDGTYSMAPFAWINLTAIDEPPYDPEIYFYISGYVFQQDPVYIYNNESQILAWTGGLSRELRLAAKTSYDEPALYWDTLYITVPPWDTLDFVYHY